jgi:hypothetical protein
MITAFKINTAIIVFLAFIFRLLFVNVGWLSSNNSSQNQPLAKSSIVTHKDQSSELKSHSYSRDYMLIELCEEDSDNEEDVVKTHPPVVLFFLQSLFGKIEGSEGSDNPFDSIKCNLFPKRYLSLSILRI